MRRGNNAQPRLPTFDTMFSGLFAIDVSNQLVAELAPLPEMSRHRLTACDADSGPEVESEPVLAQLLSTAPRDLAGEHLHVAAPAAARDTHREQGPVGDRPLGPEIHIRILGPLKISGLRSTPRRHAAFEILCFLACHPGERFTADEMREQLFPSSGPGKQVSVETFRTYVSALRAATGHEVFPAASDGTYGLGPGVTTDWDWFRAMVSFARAQPPERTGVLLTPAFDLIRGSLFSGVPRGRYHWAFDDGLVSQIEVAVIEAASLLAELCFATEEPEAALTSLRKALLATKDRDVADNLLTAAGATGNPATLERAWRDVCGALGEQSALLQASYRAICGRVLNTGEAPLPEIGSRHSWPKSEPAWLRATGLLSGRGPDRAKGPGRRHRGA